VRTDEIARPDILPDRRVIESILNAQVEPLP
jgi:hypothetical protein